MSEQHRDRRSAIRRRWQRYQIQRNRRRAAVSRELASKHRKQTERILKMQPEPEPMPMTQWLPEFAKHLSLSLRGRIRYRVADLKAVMDCV